MQDGFKNSAFDDPVEFLKFEIEKDNIAVEKDRFEKLFNQETSYTPIVKTIHKVADKSKMRMKI